MDQEEMRLAKDLFAAQMEHNSKNGITSDIMGYLTSKFFMEISLQRQLRTMDLISPWVKERLLDWGCHAGLGSCFLHKRFGESIDLYSCDVYEEGVFQPFVAFSRTKYKRLRHDYLLEYEDSFFETVLGNGVLEHVPDDRKSLREIHRVLRSGGRFLLVTLPNRWSYTEAIGRAMKVSPHDRLYTIPGATRMLQDHGFEVLWTRRYFMLPTMLIGMPPWVRRIYERTGRFYWIANDLLESVWPLNRIASSLMLVGEKK